MKFRRATAEEVPALVILAGEAFDAAVAPFCAAEGIGTFLEFASVEAMLKRMRENYVTYVAERDGTLLGMAHVRDGHHLAMLFVRPPAQRSGIGRRLVEFAAAQGAGDKLTVASTPNSEAAYRRFGFVPIADEKIDRGLRFIMMARDRTTEAAGARHSAVQKG